MATYECAHDVQKKKKIQMLNQQVQNYSNVVVQRAHELLSIKVGDEDEEDITQYEYKSLSNGGSYNWIKRNTKKMQWHILAAGHSGGFMKNKKNLPFLCRSMIKIVKFRLSQKFDSLVVYRLLRLYWSGQAIW